MTARDLSMSRFLLLSLGTALSACSPAIGDYGREYEEAFCAWQHKCHAYEKKSDCIDARTLERDPEFDYLVRAVAAGNVDYDADAAADCLDAIAERSCDYEMVTPEVCDRVFKGRVGKNAPCLSTAECAGNAVCGFNPSCGDDQCCVGACRVFADPVAVGEPCSFSGTACVPEAYCATDPVTFMPTVCTERVAVGGDCSMGQVCALETTCDENGKCRDYDLRETGERCDRPYDRCVAPAECVYGPDESVCRISGGLGSPCGGGVDCKRFDTFCDEPSGLCTLLPGPGQPCVNGYECLPYATCDGGYYDEFGEQQGNSPVCVARAGIGEACGPAEGDKRAVDCLGDLQCEAGTCVLPPLMVTEQCEPPTDE